MKNVNVGLRAERFLWLPIWKQNVTYLFTECVVIPMATTHVRVPQPVYEQAVHVKQDHDFPSIGEAIRHMCREGGYDV